MIHFINKPMPGNLPKKTSRALLDIEDNSIVPVIRNPHKVNEDSEAVFYFPGCGSERLFGQVGLATQAMLYEIGAITVLPPGYLCCGYPQNASGQDDKANQITTDNRVLFHRVANTLNYLDIKTVIVSCGTCMDQLLKYQFDKIFPGCRLLDIHEYLLEKGVKLQRCKGVRYMYHDPCHSPMKTYQPLKVVNELMGTERAAERTLLRRIRHLRRDPAAHRHPGALPQGRGNAQGCGCAARRRFHGRSEDTDFLPVLPAGPVALQRRQRHDRRLHRGGNGQTPARPELAGRTMLPRRTTAGSNGCCCEY